jgi:hypothetical protein
MLDEVVGRLGQEDHADEYGGGRAHGAPATRTTPSPRDGCSRSVKYVVDGVSDEDATACSTSVVDAACRTPRPQTGRPAAPHVLIGPASPTLAIDLCTADGLGFI